MVDVDLIRYEPNLQRVWDEFVWQSRNGTIFHTQQFISYHPPGRFEDCSLLFRYKDHLMAVFPAAIEVCDGKRILRSHPGTSYGGPVLALEAGLELTTEVVDRLVNFAQENDFNAIEMRLSPRIFHRYPCEDLDFVLWRRQFDVTEVELSSAVRLSFEDEESLMAIFRYNTWQPTRKALRAGVEIRESNDWAAYWDMLTENTARHGVRPTHSLEEIQRLHAVLPDRIKLFGAYYKGTLIAGTVVFVCNDIACHTFYIAQDYEYQRLRSQNLLLIHVLRWARSKGFRYLNFGISTEDGGRVINWGLFRFKEGFGARGVMRKYYRLEVHWDER